MANVFTKRTGKPRTTTLSDYGRGFENTKPRFFPRIPSPTRVANPHPPGLRYQLISQEKPAYGIWHPDLNKISKRIPAMVDHLRWVNFSCGPLIRHVNEMGKAPAVVYTETTTSRVSYRNPSRFPEIQGQKASRFSHTPSGGPAVGIVPNLILSRYPPVKDPENIASE
ncbi:uncharacterized protein LOC110449869 [Mizuhopecten yessoensis]|uniref:Uncharacterized protein n=1 Tax=Mizuhopecten yessoensis TaxID=6573 RepID=A0A210QQ96_MIZYE|nr:uncharacterized protein LOC110449869 [Mizuhopecten yessoensis]OWF50916.1 hypothetical protein KP79_PYT04562 [Mizuhopecten yessoensis]